MEIELKQRLSEFPNFVSKRYTQHV